MTAASQSRGNSGERGEKKTATTRTFGSIIRQRRRELDLSQEEVARRTRTSMPYIGLLEANRRHPSEKVVVRLAGVLGLDPRELFLIANPRTEALLSEQEISPTGSAWDVFSRNQNLRILHNITDQEMEILSSIAMMGEVRSPRDFVFILNAIRQALGQ